MGATSEDGGGTVTMEQAVGLIAVLVTMYFAPNVYHFLNGKWHDKLNGEYVRGVNDGMKLADRLGLTTELRAIPPEYLQVETLERWMEL